MIRKLGHKINSWYGSNGEVTSMRNGEFLSWRKGLQLDIIPKYNEIWYTSINKQKITPSINGIVSNKYIGGIGVITFANRIISIPRDAFADNTNLESVVMPSGVIEIGDSAFKNCTGLKSVTIPENVIVINNGAFCGCSGMERIMCLSYNPPAITICPPTNEPAGQYDSNAIFKEFTTDEITANHGSGYYQYYAFKYVDWKYGNIEIWISKKTNSSASDARVGQFLITTNPPKNGTTTKLRELTYLRNDGRKVTIYKDAIESWENQIVDGYFYIGIKYSVNVVGASIKAKDIEFQNSVFDNFSPALYCISRDYSLSDGWKNFQRNNVSSIVGRHGNLIWRINGDVLEITGNGNIEAEPPWLQYKSIIKTIIINSGVKIIGYKAFYEFNNVVSISIPDSVIQIDSDAFYNCTKLIASVPSTVSQISSSAFYNALCVLYYGSSTGSPWGAKYVNKYIDGDFLYNDSAKTELISYIGSSDSITIPAGVVSIGSDAISNTALTYLEIPESVTTINSAIGAKMSTNSTLKVKRQYNVKFIDDETGSSLGTGKTYHVYIDVSATNTDNYWNASSMLGTGMAKKIVTYNVYTDNSTVKSQIETFGTDQYTTVNIYHLDGSAWS